MSKNKSALAYLKDCQYVLGEHEELLERLQPHLDKLPDKIVRHIDNLSEAHCMLNSDDINDGKPAESFFDYYDIEEC